MSNTKKSNDSAGTTEEKIADVPTSAEPTLDEILEATTEAMSDRLEVDGINPEAIANITPFVQIACNALEAVRLQAFVFKDIKKIERYSSLMSDMRKISSYLPAPVKATKAPIALRTFALAKCKSNDLKTAITDKKSALVTYPEA